MGRPPNILNLEGLPDCLPHQRIGDEGGSSYALSLGSAASGPSLPTALRQLDSHSILIGGQVQVCQTVSHDSHDLSDHGPARNYAPRHPPARGELGNSGSTIEKADFEGNRMVSRPSSPPQTVQ